MTDKELRRLKRGELLEIIVQQREEIEKLEAKLNDATARLDARYIRLDVENPGSWEETARALVGVLEKGVLAADEADAPPADTPDCNP